MTVPTELVNDVNELLNTLNSVNANTNEVEGKLDSVISELQDIELDIESVDVNTDEIESLLNTTISELQDIEADVESVDANTDTLESELQDVNTELDSIDNLLDELENALQSVGTDQLRVDVENNNAGLSTEATLLEVLDRLQGGSTQTNNLESAVSSTLDRLRLYNGQFYEHSFLFDSIKDGNSRFYFINNPSGSDVIIDIGTITVESGGKADITTSFNVTVNSAGTQRDPRNKDADITDTEVFEIFTGGSYSGGEDELTFTLPGGVGETALGTNASTETNLLRPGNNMLIEIFNNSGRSEDTSVQLEMAEVPE